MPSFTKENLQNFKNMITVKLTSTDAILRLLLLIGVFLFLKVDLVKAQYLPERSIPVESHYYSGVYFVNPGQTLPDSILDQSTVLGEYGVSAWVWIGVLIPIKIWTPWAFRMKRHMRKRAQKKFPDVDVVDFTSIDLSRARAIQLPADYKARIESSK